MECLHTRSFVEEQLHTAVVQSYGESVMEAQIRGACQSPVPVQRIANPPQRISCEQRVPFCHSLEARPCVQGVANLEKHGSGTSTPTNVPSKPFEKLASSSVICVGLPVGKLVTQTSPFTPSLSEANIIKGNKQSCRSVAGSGSIGQQLPVENMSSRTKLSCFQSAVKSMLEHREPPPPGVEEPPPPGVEDYFSSRLGITYGIGGRTNPSTSTFPNQSKTGMRHNGSTGLVGPSLELKLCSFGQNGGFGVDSLAMIQGELLTAVKKNYSKVILSALISEQLGCWLNDKNERGKASSAEKDSSCKKVEEDKNNHCDAAQSKASIWQASISESHSIEETSSQVSGAQGAEACVRSEVTLSFGKVKSSSSHENSAVDSYNAHEMIGTPELSSKLDYSMDASHSKVLPFIRKVQEMLRDLEREESAVHNEENSSSHSKSSGLSSSYLEGYKAGMVDSDFQDEELLDDVEQDATMELNCRKLRSTKHKGISSFRFSYLTICTVYFSS